MTDPMSNRVKGLNSPSTKSVSLTNNANADIPGGALRALHVNQTGTITGWQLDDDTTSPAYPFFVAAGTEPALRLKRIATGAELATGLR